MTEYPDSLMPVCRSIIEDFPGLLPPDEAGIMLQDETLLAYLKKEFPEVIQKQQVLKDLEICLYRLLPLTLNNYAALAICLNDLYPEADLINMSDEDIFDLIRVLPNFLSHAHKEEHTTDLLRAVLYSWIHITGEGFDDTAFDAYV